MVYHNLSMSLNHHVPIFNCTVTRRGGLSLLFGHLSNCKVTVLGATWLAFPRYTHRLMAAFGYIHVQSQPHPSPSCDITCFGS